MAGSGRGRRGHPDGEPRSAAPLREAAAGYDGLGLRQPGFHRAVPARPVDDHSRGVRGQPAPLRARDRPSALGVAAGLDVRGRNVGQDWPYRPGTPGAHRGQRRSDARADGRCGSHHPRFAGPDGCRISALCGPVRGVRYRLDARAGGGPRVGVPAAGFERDRRTGAGAVCAGYPAARVRREDRCDGSVRAAAGVGGQLRLVQGGAARGRGVRARCGAVGAQLPGGGVAVAGSGAGEACRWGAPAGGSAA